MLRCALFVVLLSNFFLPLPLARSDATIDPGAVASWQGWENLQGTTYFGPECISTQPSRIDCFTAGPANAISRRSWDGSVWRDWTPVPGVVPANTVNGYYYPLRVECVS